MGNGYNRNSRIAYLPGDINPQSIVYLGVTEEICASILEKHSGLKCVDFKIGYSPERINRGQGSPLRKYRQDPFQDGPETLKL